MSRQYACSKGQSNEDIGRGSFETTRIAMQIALLRSSALLRCILTRKSSDKYPVGICDTHYSWDIPNEDVH